jgi:hypothetical protein
MIDNTTSTNISLGNPFFVEKGKITGQRVLTLEPQLQIEYTLLADGLMNDNLNVTDTGTITSTIRNDRSFFSRGQGMIMIKEDSSEMATWLAYMVGNKTQEERWLLVEQDSIIRTRPENWPFLGTL